MDDEKYVFFQDLREKKITGYSARKQRSHCGKGGRVKLPSDYLTKKELKNMSGECKSYRLNSPMSWGEFRSMPEDLQITYIKLIREKWNPPLTAIGKMMGVDRSNLSRYLLLLGFEKQSAGAHSWDKMGFAEWCHGIPKHEDKSLQEILEETSGEDVECYETVVEDAPAEVEQEFVEEETPVTEECPYKQIPNPGIKVKLVNAEKELKQEAEIRFKKVIPSTGSMTYEGLTFDILSSLADLLGNAKVLLSVKWDVVED